MNNFDHLRATYFEECAELIDSVYANLAAIEAGSDDDETIHAIFRAIHSIKGGGGAFRFERLVAFAHVLETLLDLLRDAGLAFSHEIAGLLLRATDVLADLIGAERNEEAMVAGFEAQLRAELEQTAAAAGNRAVGEPADRAGGTATKAATTSGTYHLHFLPHTSLFESANEPLLLIRALKLLGSTVVTVDLAQLPSLEHMDPEAAYIGWTIDLVTDASVEAITEIFEFVTDHCTLTIKPAGVSDVLSTDAAPVASDIVAATIVAAAAGVAMPGSPGNADPAAARRGTPMGAQTVRVDVEKVDRLVNLVGEMVINQAMLMQLGAGLPPGVCAGLIAGLESLSQHLRELQEGVMAIRTQPVSSVFSRMPRLVRELSGQLGKEVRLMVTGEGTEIDKTMIEQLADPLTHLIRNALDHGIESPDERVARGKPPQGTVHLGAEHRSGRIIIEISDDGGGINRTRVLARAHQRGLIAPDASPGDEEIDDLIFLPGFSTVDVVSNVSGRGVGMDVVRRNIQALGGRVTVQSRCGAGSRFILSLPLTLAILDGMIVAVGHESYIIPLANIVESLRPQRGDIHAVVGRGDVVSIRGSYVPLVYLADRFSVPDAVTDPAQGIVVVVENETAGKIGLVVDDLLGQQQVVVKSLESNYGAVDGVGGATILGDGRVALILDIAGLRSLPARGCAGQALPPDHSTDFAEAVGLAMTIQ